MKFKKVISSIGIGLATYIMLTGTAHANVQSRPDNTRLTRKTAGQFFTLIRKMETEGGPMGLSATIDDSGNETSSSNNIDAHMIKNTEWGAAVMLMDSAYGSKTSGESSTATTTGNASGVYQMFSGYEYVAGIYSTSTSYTSNWSTIKNAPAKYWNDYQSGNSITGDATKETHRWKGASYAGFVSASFPVFKRGPSGAFSYYCSDYVNGGDAGSYFGSRAVVVCGAGF